jgi:hypothetical protein
MITKRTIKVPIYDYKITIVVADDWREAKKILPCLEEGNRACVLEGPNDSTIVIPPKQSGYVVHECVHLKDCIWNYIGYTPDASNDEVDAYLVEYLFNEVCKVIDRHNDNTLLKI